MLPNGLKKMAKILSSEEKATLLQRMQGWTEVESRNAIQKTFSFNDFNDAFAFMRDVALKAEAMNHHPEWFNVWNRVDVTLNTHDVGGLSELDFKMATRMNQYAA